MAKCLKCGHEWTPRLAHPARCPSCLSKYWDEPRRGKQKKGQSDSQDTPNTAGGEPTSGLPAFYCDECGNQLHQSYWNAAVDSLHCRNQKCPQCSMIVKFVTTGSSSEYRVFRPGEGNKTKGKGSTRYGREEEAETKDDFLQRMRDRILSQRQTPEVP